MLQAETFQGVHGEVKRQLNVFLGEHPRIRIEWYAQSVIGTELEVTLIYREPEDVETQEDYDRD